MEAERLAAAERRLTELAVTEGGQPILDTLALLYEINFFRDLYVRAPALAEARVSVGLSSTVEEGVSRIRRGALDRLILVITA